MAWAERLPSGKWRGVYRDSFNKRRSAGVFPHKAKALRAASVKEEDVRTSLTKNADAHKQTWGEWEPTWWASRTVGEGTLKRDSSRRDQYLKPKWGDVPLGQITRHDVKAWVADLRRGKHSAKPLSNATVQRIIHLFSASLVAAVDAEIIRANPAARLKLPPAPATKDRYLDRDTEFGAIMSNLPTTDDQLVMMTLVFTGLRFGELSALKWSQVNLSDGWLRVSASYDDETGVVAPFPKGKKPRVVPMVPGLVEQLKIKKARDKPRPSELVFTSDQGKTLRRSNWDNVFRSALEATNLGTRDEPVRPEPATLHDLRHTYCSWLAQAGVPLVEIGRLAGHASTTTTQRYAHLAPTDTSRVFAALGSLAPLLPHAADAEVVAIGGSSRSSRVGPVGLEPTTRGLKGRLD